MSNKSTKSVVIGQAVAVAAMQQDVQAEPQTRQTEQPIGPNTERTPQEAQLIAIEAEGIRLEIVETFCRSERGFKESMLAIGQRIGDYQRLRLSLNVSRDTIRDCIDLDLNKYSSKRVESFRIAKGYGAWLLLAKGQGIDDGPMSWGHWEDCWSRLIDVVREKTEDRYVVKEGIEEEAKSIFRECVQIGCNVKDSIGRTGDLLAKHEAHMAAVNRERLAKEKLAQQEQARETKRLADEARKLKEDAEKVAREKELLEKRIKDEQDEEKRKAMTEQMAQKKAEQDTADRAAIAKANETANATAALSRTNKEVDSLDKKVKKGAKKSASKVKAAIDGAAGATKPVQGPPVISIPELARQAGAKDLGAMMVQMIEFAKSSEEVMYEFAKQLRWSKERATAMVGGMVDNKPDAAAAELALNALIAEADEALEPEQAPALAKTA